MTEGTGAFECRVCGHLGLERRYCPECLAETMQPSEQPLPPGRAREAPEEPDPFEIPIDGTLDLHTVAPSEVKEILPEYLAQCLARGIREVRVVHGKGKGALRRSVQALLARSPLVADHRTADESAGGWGATLVTLRDPE